MGNVAENSLEVAMEPHLNNGKARTVCKNYPKMVALQRGVQLYPNECPMRVDGSKIYNAEHCTIFSTTCGCRLPGASTNFMTHGWVSWCNEVWLWDCERVGSFCSAALGRRILRSSSSHKPFSVSPTLRTSVFPSSADVQIANALLGPVSLLEIQRKELVGSVNRCCPPLHCSNLSL
jgi:hypothetical protein